jgi:hypothetical protein
MSPGQRAAGKHQVNAWLPAELWERIEQEARASGRPRSAVAEDLIREGLRKHGVKVRGKKK